MIEALQSQMSAVQAKMSSMEDAMSSMEDAFKSLKRVVVISTALGLTAALFRLLEGRVDPKPVQSDRAWQIAVDYRILPLTAGP